jgi:hypothetical protein
MLGQLRRKQLVHFSTNSDAELAGHVQLRGTRPVLETSLICHRTSGPAVVPLVGIDHRLLLGSTIGSFADQPSALSPVIKSTIERTNTRIVGPAHSLTSLNSLSCSREKKNSSNRGTPARKFFVSAAHQRTIQH